MTDYLAPELSERETGAISALGLAHMGDCVYEILVRTRLCTMGKLTGGSLHRATVGYVSAAHQAEAVQRLLPLLTDEESAVFRRGRNAKVNSMPKNADPAQYHAATGLEALFGWLWLRGRRERINELFAAAVGGEEA